MGHSRSGKFAVLLAALILLAQPCAAHPASGIVVDSQGRIYFVFTGRGVMRVESTGKLTNIHEDPAGHWLALDEAGAFSRVTPREFKRITPDGVVPGLIDASGGAPLVVGLDGNLYYGSNGSKEESYPPGALTVVRLSPSGSKDVFPALLKQKLAELKDGITGLALGPDGTIFVATWKGIIKLNSDGSIGKVFHPVRVEDCDSDPADHNPANADSPLFRGLGVDSGGNVFVAATSCHRVVEVTPEGRVTTVLKSERPWSPTGVAVRGKEIYVLEYTNANGPKTEGWVPRIRKRSADGTWTTVFVGPPPGATSNHP